MQGFAQLRAARKSQQADRRVGQRGKLEVDVHPQHGDRHQQCEPAGQVPQALTPRLSRLSIANRRSTIND